MGVVGAVVECGVWFQHLPLARAGSDRASRGRARERKLNLHPGPQTEGVVQDHGRETVASLGQDGLRFATPKALGAVGAGARAKARVRRVAALLASPAALSLGSIGDLGSPPNTLARKAARGHRRPGPKPEPRRGTREPEQGGGSDPVPENARLLQDLSSTKQLQEGSASFRRNPLCGSPLLVSLEPSPSSPPDSPPSPGRGPRGLSPPSRQKRGFRQSEGAPCWPDAAGAATLLRVSSTRRPRPRPDPPRPSHAPGAGACPETQKTKQNKAPKATLTCRLLKGSSSVMNVVFTTTTKTSWQTEVVSHVLMKEWGTPLLFSSFLRRELNFS
ncbi:translation initiation factor IF-2-like [Panthera pardus]|uniref:Translation initiation factor IF-2-like n=1 Tax=Panthera pardus TaxID=9691 RepID=A0A9W2V915_PANPR|nr:translation initiation factor IF-2-like [Panthera pardus]